MSDATRSFPWRTLLALSVVLNLVVISAAAGAYLSGARLMRPAGAGAMARLPGPRVFMDALPPQRRAEIRRELLRTAFDRAAERQEARAARMALFEAARAEPYDAERVRAAFARVRTADAALLGSFHDSLAVELGRLTPDERRAALDAIARQRGMRPAGATPAPQD